MGDIYENIEEYNLNKKRKMLAVFDEIIAYMLSNKKIQQIAIELFIKGRKLKISIVFIAQSYFALPKNRLNSTHYFTMEIPNERDVQKIAFNHSSDTNFKDLMNLCKKSTARLYSFLVNDTTLASDNPLCFR